MRKEVIIAIFVGVSFGLLITFGVYQARLSLSGDTTTKHVSETIEDTPDSNNGQLAIHNPEDETIQKEASVSVTGTTLPDIYVVVFANNDETITTSDGSGSFSVDVDLEENSNVISVFAVDEDGNTISEERTVIVSSDSFANTTTSNTKEEASDSADKNEEDTE